MEKTDVWRHVNCPKDAPVFMGYDSRYKYPIKPKTNLRIVYVGGLVILAILVLAHVAGLGL